MPEWVAYGALFGAGLVAGALNVVAGGGSFLTLPILIFLGLPPTVANGTNRVAILVQNVGAVWSFDRHGVLDWRRAGWAAVPAALGAVGGSLLALAISDDAFRRVLAFLMVAVSLWTLWDPIGRRKRTTAPAPSEETEAGTGSGQRWLLAAGFFLVGLYGGFVQAGVGFLVLAVTTLAGLDLVRGNALKVLVILVFTPIALAVFAWSGHVHWGLGLLLGAGNFLGGLLGVRLTVLKGQRWIKAVVTVTVIAFALKLWIAP